MKNEEGLKIKVDIEIGSTTNKCGVTISKKAIEGMSDPEAFIQTISAQLHHKFKKVIPKMLEIEGLIELIE